MLSEWRRREFDHRRSESEFPPIGQRTVSEVTSTRFHARRGHSARMSRVRDGRLRAVMSLYIMNPMGRIFDRQTKENKKIFCPTRGEQRLKRPGTLPRGDSIRQQNCAPFGEMFGALDSAYIQRYIARPLREAFSRSVTYSSPLRSLFKNLRHLYFRYDHLSISISPPPPAPFFSHARTHANPSRRRGGGGCSPRTPEGKERKGKKKKIERDGRKKKGFPGGNAYADSKEEDN